MSQVISGYAMYGRTVKTGEYENKKAEVQFEFHVDEGEDHNAVAKQAGKDALALCNSMLGIAKAPAKEAEAKPAKAKEAETTKPAEADDIGLDTPPARTPEQKAEKKAAVEKIAAEENAISDAALHAAAQNKAQALGEGGGQKVKALVKEYNPDPAKGFSLKDVPQDKRADFLTRLAALGETDDKKSGDNDF